MFACFLRPVSEDPLGGLRPRLAEGNELAEFAGADAAEVILAEAGPVTVARLGLVGGFGQAVLADRSLTGDARTEFLNRSDGRHGVLCPHFIVSGLRAF